LGANNSEYGGTYSGHGRHLLKSRHLSEPAIFVAEVAKRPKNPLTFSGIRRIRIARISGMFVRLANENLPIPEYILIPEYSQTNAP